MGSPYRGGVTLFGDVLPAPSGTTHNWRADAARALGVVVGTVLLGAPVGLLWSLVSPRVRFSISDSGLDLPGVESSEAFIGADGSYLLLAFGAGLLCGLLAWLVARRSGPWTVVALAVGGTLAALVAARVGLMPGAHEVLEALKPGATDRGGFDLFLGARGEGDELHLRAPWAAVAWPVGALVAFLGCGLARPEDLD